MLNKKILYIFTSLFICQLYNMKIFGKNILIVFALLLVFYNESEAQFSYYNNKLVNDSLNLENSNLTKPRPGFKKRRFRINTIFLEGGYFWSYYTGTRYSINYDILMQSGEKSAFTARIGYGLNNAVKDSLNDFNQEPFIPIGINILIGRINELEFGAGGYYFKYRKIIPPYLSIGFRHQSPRGGFMFRVACDIHLERVYNTNGTEISKTAAYGPLLGLGWTF
ncbi:MAG: hypothetical protein COZ59_00350 [Bacteroidetes bacterium CG_4_8_14_3_um_filter_31_14]|nr:MAG: hypothetical protein COZ59_00350 [Bacteroidetes bacterium CG_4_8_14_3_um_filter_31_14]